MSAHLPSTRVIEGPSPHLEIDAVELRVVAGPDRGAVLELGADSVRIGTAPGCELVLHDPTVSTRHAEISLTRRGYLLRDLHSKNGVLLGRVPVERVVLIDGLRLQLGETALVVRAAGPPRTVPLAAAGRVGSLVAHSLSMRAAAASLRTLAAAEVTVLLEGETGTGKEVAARALHDLSARAGGPFVVFDCGAAPPGLLAAELFGHERGAFTGADTSRAGLFEQADGGTLFLDEIGEMALELQPTLLRALETRRTRRVGGRQEVAHDVRLIAATNRGLAEEIKAGRFRQDLYFRIAVAKVVLPPLRDRVEDVPHLAAAFAAEVGFHLPPEILPALEGHGWPGNVRELRNAVHCLAAGAPLPFDAARPVGSAAPSFLLDGDRLRTLPEARHLAGDDFERLYLETVIERAQGNLSRAAELAGVSRQMLTRLVAKHGLRRGDRQPGGDGDDS